MEQKKPPHINPATGRPIDSMWIRVSCGLAAKFRTMCSEMGSSCSNEVNMMIASAVQSYEEEHGRTLPMPEGCIAEDLLPYLGKKVGRPVTTGGRKKGGKMGRPRKAEP